MEHNFVRVFVCVLVCIMICIYRCMARYEPPNMQLWILWIFSRNSCVDIRRTNRENERRRRRKAKKNARPTKKPSTFLIQNWNETTRQVGTIIQPEQENCLILKWMKTFKTRFSDFQEVREFKFAISNPVKYSLHSTELASWFSIWNANKKYEMEHKIQSYSMYEQLKIRRKLSRLTWKH